MAESVLPSHPAPALTGPRVVLRFADKTLSKGTIQGFDPASPTLEFSPLAHREMRREIALRELKAIFFVHTFEGERDRDVPEQLQTATGYGHPCVVLFHDGEEMHGQTAAYHPHRIGFFLYPLDRGGNNERIFVINGTVKSFRWI